VERRLKRLARSLVLRTLGKDRAQALITRMARWLDIDLVLLGYRSVGILNYETPALTGENHLIGKVLPKLIRDEGAVILDVGANRGEISIALRRAFPHARVVAFEPNPLTYESLVENVRGLGIECIHAGLGSAEGTGVLHCYRGNQTSGHASMYRDMFTLYEGYGVDGAGDLTTFEFPIRTLDETCASLGMAGEIAFLKIDVEGHELQVLKGARELLAARRVALIQFEFNECNVLSRSYMRDFYDMLGGFSFFRLAPDRLVPLGSYGARLEIFQFQNILAVREDLLALPVWQTP
jgi:FkbM family methyltransferase